MKMNKTKKEVLNERIRKINEALSLLEEAKNLVDDAVHGTDQKNHYEAYGCYGFDQLIGNGNPCDSSLYSLISELKEEFSNNEEL